MRHLPAPFLDLPFESAAHRSAMHFETLPQTDTFRIDSLYPGQIALRRELLRSHRPEVFAAVEGSTAARREVLGHVATMLLTAYPDDFRLEDGRLHNAINCDVCNIAEPEVDPLEAAGLLVQEDLCLLHASPDGHRLAAAMVCFPTRWRLADKIGRGLEAIHEPVPEFSGALLRPVERVIERLLPGRLIARFNWSVMDDPALFQPGGKHRPISIDASEVGDRLVLRVERQTLSRLPASGSILFTIRVQIHPLRVAIATSRNAERFAATIRAMTPAMRRYKSLDGLSAPLLAWLDDQAASDHI